MGGGAGKAMVRTSHALSVIGVESTILSRSGTYYSNVDEIEYSNLGIHKRIQSSAVTFLQSKILQKSRDLVTPVSIKIINLRSPALNQADIIHIHATYNFINHSSLDYIFRLGKPIFFTLHDQRFFTGGCHYSRDCLSYQNSCNKCPQVQRIAQPLVSNSFRIQQKQFSSNSSTHIIVPSRWLAQKAKEAAITKNLQISVVKNPIPNPYFESSMKDTSKNEHPPKVQIGFISDQLQNPYKGIEILIKAVNSIAKDFENRISIIFVGHGNKPDVTAGISLLQTQARNDLEMIQILKSIDVLVVPSNQDNSPSVVGEALAMGITVIGSDTGGIPEVLSEFGMPIFPSNDWQALARILSESCKTYTSRSDIRKRASLLFSEKAHAEIMVKHYTDAIRGFPKIKGKDHKE